jgi:uncharacterized protein
MAAPPLIPNYETTADERSMATLAHVLQVVGAWIAPLIIFIIRRESKFVAFHALQALFLQICYLIVMVCGMVVFMVTMIASIAASGAHNNSQPPVAIFVFFPLLWLLIMGFWVMVLITAIMYGIKANRGEWAQYPVIGGWVRRILHI